MHINRCAQSVVTEHLPSNNMDTRICTLRYSLPPSAPSAQCIHDALRHTACALPVATELILFTLALHAAAPMPCRCDDTAHHVFWMVGGVCWPQRRARLQGWIQVTSVEQARHRLARQNISKHAALQSSQLCDTNHDLVVGYLHIAIWVSVKESS